MFENKNIVYENHNTQKNHKTGFMLFEIVFSLAIFSIIIVSIYEYSYYLNSSLNLAELKIKFYRHADNIFNNLNNLLKNYEFGTDDLDKFYYFQFQNGIDIKVETILDNYGAYLIASLNTNDKDKRGLIHKRYIRNLISKKGSLRCSVTKENLSDFNVYRSDILVNQDSLITGLDIIGDYILISIDSPLRLDPDLMVLKFNSNDHNNFEIVSKLDTGPGILAIDVVDKYVYAGNTGSNSQLQIINIENKEFPYLEKSIGISTSTGLIQRPVSILFFLDKLYIGLTKASTSPEFIAFNAVDRKNPVKIYDLELNTQVNSILRFKNYILLATPTERQLQLFQENYDSVTYLNSFSPSGYSVQEGNYLNLVNRNILFGRTVGGFNNTKNHEYFVFNAENLPNFDLMFSEDIGASVYGIHTSGDDFLNSIIVMGLSKNSIKFSDTLFPLGTPASDFKCSGNKLIVATKENGRVYLFEQK